MTLQYPGTIIQFNGFGADNYTDTHTTGPDDASFKRRILCEGDSWFSIGAIPSSNLLNPLKFSQRTLLVNLAKPGDTIKRMSAVSKNPTLATLVKENNFATKWDAILLSGGGNDLIDMADQIICTPSVGAGKEFLDYINRIELTNMKMLVQQGYKQIARLRENSKNATTPIITHTYDYPTPRNAKAKFIGLNVSGPWLLPALKVNDVPEVHWISITDYIFETLASALIELSYQIDNFHVISATRECLVRARLGTTGEDGDWLNEIHPSTRGYEKLGAIISEEIDKVLNHAR
jgi:hypothetical protein